jgi:alpha-D-ribose 1-methylphosphonate 5-triphosphate synthase subunit PhnI
MGYTTVSDRTGAVAAAARLAVGTSHGGAAPPLVLDQLMAEAGVVEPAIAARALDQAGGDLARACSLVRAWAAVLPRLGTCGLDWEELRPLRRITPGFAEPRGGQYLGASLDYEQRILELEPSAPADGHVETCDGGSAPECFPRAVEGLAARGLVAPAALLAQPADVTRTAVDRTGRGALLQLLSRADTGAMTALAYTYIRGFASRQDPTLLELRRGTLPVRLTRPDGGEVTVGEIEATLTEVALYRLHGEQADARLTIGVGATPGRLERRAVAAGVLDAACARAAADPPGHRQPCEDPEFLAVALDGQEASGFVEHLKLPHHVTFTSELDRLMQAGGAAPLRPFGAPPPARGGGGP